MALEPGTGLGPYRIIEPLGGGSGTTLRPDGRSHGARGEPTVYKAEDTRLGRDVAVKTLPSECLDHEDCRLRFEREASILARLEHPNIVTINDIWDVGRMAPPASVRPSLPLIVMGLFAGKTLSKVLTDVGSLQGSQAVNILRPVARALDYIHESGIVHRDVTPRHILLTRRALSHPRHSDEVWLIDFRIAGTMPTQEVVGPQVDHRSDIFSLGAVAFEMLTGQGASEGASKAALLIKLLHEAPPSARQWHPELPVAC